jgi:apolipoprotein D and lipocalin family protein
MIMKLIPIIFVFVAISCSGQKTNRMDQKIEYGFPFELEKYLGTWYEIARFDHNFERGLQGVTASYSLLENGMIKVVNQGYKNSLKGEPKKAIGKAKIPDKNDLRKLKVSFFWFFYADYFILELDSDYKYAVIGSSSDKYLWILSRTPQLDTETYQNILNKIESRGYSTKKLIKVEQPTQ